MLKRDKKIIQKKTPLMHTNDQKYQELQSTQGRKITKARTDVLVTKLAGHHWSTTKEAEQMVAAVHSESQGVKLTNFQWKLMLYKPLKKESTAKGRWEQSRAEATSIEPEKERLLVRRRLRLEEPVEERPTVPLVHRHVAGELGHARALRLAGEAWHPVGVTLVAGQRQRAGREGEQGESGDEAEEETRCCHRHGSVGDDGLGAWHWEWTGKWSWGVVEASLLVFRSVPVRAIRTPSVAKGRIYGYRVLGDLLAIRMRTMFDNKVPFWVKIGSSC